MFVLSKIFWIVLNPANIFMFFLILGTVLLFTRYRRAGRRTVAGATVFVVIIGVFPVGTWMTEYLENRFPANPEIPADIAGIITLGGTINQFLTADRGQPALMDGAERLTEFVHLARRFPNARLVFSGGSGSLIHRELKEADAAKIFFDQMGLGDRAIVYESQARNTSENAILTRDSIGPEAAQRKWVLITSAEHMPRTVGVFRAAGMDIIPYPVDYKTDGKMSFDIRFRPVQGLGTLNKALREWIGLVAYRILGRTGTLVPSPADLADN